MLKKDSALIIIAVMLLYSCNHNKEERAMRIKDSNEYKESVKKIGITTYIKVYQSLMDSALIWEKNNSKCWRNCHLNVDVKFDSLLCFNSDSNKFVTALLEQNDNVMDGLDFYYGVKINSKWYFFPGAKIYLPRKNYQKDIRTPLSFAKLHEIAMREVFSGYLIEKKTKKDMGWWKNTFAPKYSYSYEINESFFEGMANKNQSGRGYGSCFDCQTFEDYVLYLVRKNWEKR
jgi:hypothetical protein